MEKSLYVIKNEKEKFKFSDAEKRRLICAIKKRNHIWDKSHKLHCNRNAMKTSWIEISKEIGKPDEACKQNWRSILDSRRCYKQKYKASKKSGSGCDLEFSSEESQDPWEFSKDLEFLTEASELRTTSCSQLLSTEDLQPTQNILKSSSVAAAICINCCAAAQAANIIVFSTISKSLLAFCHESCK